MTMKKILSFLLFAVLLIPFAVSAFAEDKYRGEDGFDYVLVDSEDLLDSREVILDHLESKVSQFPGYVHEHKENYYITYELNAAAARDVLRYSARLQELNEYQKKCADVNFDGVINSKDARDILRVSAKLDTFKIKLAPGESFVFGRFNILSNGWLYSALTESSDGLNVENIIYPNTAPKDYVGSTDSCITVVTPTKPGEYIFKAQMVAYGGKLMNELTLKIICES